MAKWIEVIGDEYGRKILINVENIISIEEHEHKGVAKTKIVFSCGFLYTKHSYIELYEKVNEAR